MNISAYVFGALKEKNELYPDNSVTVIVNKTITLLGAESQVVIQRQGAVMYYTYVRRFDSTHWFGMGVSINGYYLKSMTDVFSLFEKLMSKIALQGIFLRYTESGITYSSRNSLSDYDGECLYWVDKVKDAFTDVVSGILPPVDFSRSKYSIKTFHHTETDSEIATTSCKFPTTVVLKPGKNASKEDLQRVSNLQALKDKLNNSTI